MFDNTCIIGRITVDVVLECDASIQGSSILPLNRSDGSVDELALSEYEEFIINALEVFDEHDFELIEEAESNRSKSMYFSFVKKDDYTNQSYKYILFVRISDHAINSGHKGMRKDYYKNKAEEMKRPQTKGKQTWRFKEIIVNKSTFGSYDDALDAIDQRLQNT